MSTPANASGRIGSTVYVLPLNSIGLPALRSEARNLIDAEGEVVLDQHLPHDFADRTGRADHRNAWQHGKGSFR